MFATNSFFYNYNRLEERYDVQTNLSSAHKQNPCYNNVRSSSFKGSHQMNAEKVMILYADAYKKLYKRMPKDLRALDNNWVVVNGARIQVGELEHLTARLMHEYNQSVAQKKNMMSRLINWFKQ